MAAHPKAYFTPEQYLALDRAAEMKSEYLSGEMLAMAGASRAHNFIVTNLIRELSSILRRRPCEAYPSDMRVKVSPAAYTYPDVVVVCGEPIFDDTREDVLLNPSLLIEVLSPSTEAYDRGEKFAHGRRIDSLTDYVLVSSEQPRVEHYARQSDGRWLLSEAAELDAELTMDQIGVTLHLSDLYERVSLATLPQSP